MYRMQIVLTFTGTRVWRYDSRNKKRQVRTECRDKPEYLQACRYLTFQVKYSNHCPCIIFAYVGACVYKEYSHCRTPENFQYLSVILNWIPGASLPRIAHCFPYIFIRTTHHIDFILGGASLNLKSVLHCFTEDPLFTGIWLVKQSLYISGPTIHSVH